MAALTASSMAAKSESLMELSGRLNAQAGDLYEQLTRIEQYLIGSQPRDSATTSAGGPAPAPMLCQQLRDTNHVLGNCHSLITRIKEGIGI